MPKAPSSIACRTTARIVSSSAGVGAPIASPLVYVRAVPALDLPAGKTVELKPGGYHVMLMDLKTPLLKDTTVPLTLVFKDAKGAQIKQEIALPIAIRAPGASTNMPAGMDHSQHKH